MSLRDSLLKLLRSPDPYIDRIRKRIYRFIDKPIVTAISIVLGVIFLITMWFYVFVTNFSLGKP